MIAELYHCIVFEHDYRFLTLAVFLSLFLSFSAVSLQQRVRLSEGKIKLKWIIFSAVAIGSGIWSTHFLAMIAYDAGTPVSYNILPTFASIIVAIVISGLGFAYSALRHGKSVRIIAGAIVGVGICCMHFLGMTAMQLRGTVSHDSAFVIAAIVSGIFFSIVSFQSMNKNNSLWRYVGSSLLLALAICALHFTATAGLVITYDSSLEMVDASVSQEFVGISTVFVSFILLGCSFAAAYKSQNEAFLQAIEVQRLHRLSDASLEGVVVMDNQGAILNANHSFCEMSGNSLPELYQRNIWRFFNNVKSDQEIPVLTAQRVHMEEARLMTKNHTILPVELFFYHIEQEHDVSYIMVVRDNSEQRAVQYKFNYVSNYDTLTGLVNRHLFMDRLTHAARMSAGKEEDVAIFYIDIDGFKEINSLYGSDVGDAILTKVAKRLKDVIPNTGTLARFGGDQFCLLQEDIDHPSTVMETAEVLTSAFSQPIIIPQGNVSLSISVGVSVEPIDENDPESLLSKAEVAVKQAKKNVGSSYRFYEDQFDKTIVRRRRLKRDLQDAIKFGEISLVYQPQFHCLDQRVTGFEALVRWNHPELGFINPEEFIALAEESNQINILGAWILNAACKEASRWHKDLSIAVNLSPVQFQQANLMEVIEETLERYDLRPDRLELEITEGVLIRDSDKALTLLNKLKDKGIKLAMDDFGTGYSSLAYLQTFPFDKLKIDKSFVQVMLDSDHKLNIVRGMIGLARGLKMPVLAEGVETEAQHAILRAEGCNEVQGYYLGRPKPIRDYVDLIENPMITAEA